MNRHFNWMDKPITWGAFLALSGICTVVGTVIAAVELGTRLVDRHEGLCKKTVQEVNCRHIGRSRGEVVTTRPLLFSQKLH